jgi:hypothetical protein
MSLLLYIKEHKGMYRPVGTGVCAFDADVGGRAAWNSL